MMLTLQSQKSGLSIATVTSQSEVKKHYCYCYFVLPLVVYIFSAGGICMIRLSGANSALITQTA